MHRGVIAMKILIVCVVILFGVCSWCLCASNLHDPHEDEEQANYLKEWSEKHKR